LFQLGRQLIEFGYGFGKGFFIVGFNRQFQQAGDVFAALFQLIDGFHDGFKRRALFTQRLCALGVVPNIRLFQLGVDFF
jgi:hypothetical protein